MYELLRTGQKVLAGGRTGASGNVVYKKTHGPAHSLLFDQSLKDKNTTLHTILYFSYTSICHLRPQIAKARRGGRRGKVTEVITHDIVKF